MRQKRDLDKRLNYFGQLCELQKDAQDVVNFGMLCCGI